MRFGVTVVIIVGGRNLRNMFNYGFYEAVENIMKSTAFLCFFQVYNIAGGCFYFDADSKCHLHAFLQHQALTNPMKSLNQLKQEQKIMSKETPDLEDASCSLQSWKAKDNQLYVLEVQNKALEMYTYGQVMLTRGIDKSIAASDFGSFIFLSKELAKIFTNKSKMWSKIAKKNCQENEVIQVSKVFNRIFSLEYCIANAAFNAFRGILLNLLWDRSNERLLLEVKQLLKVKYSNTNLNLGEQYVNLKKRIEEEEEQKTVFRLREAEFGPAIDDHLVNCVSMIEKHRREYNSSDPKNVIKLIRQRRKLSKNISNELQLYFNLILFGDQKGIEKLAEIILNTNGLIHIALEVLEWNPYDATVCAKTSEFLEFVMKLMLDFRLLFLQIPLLLDEHLIPGDVWNQMVGLPFAVWLMASGNFDLNEHWELIREILGDYKFCALDPNRSDC